MRRAVWVAAALLFVPEFAAPQQITPARVTPLLVAPQLAALDAGETFKNNLIAGIQLNHFGEGKFLGQFAYERILREKVALMFDITFLYTRITVFNGGDTEYFTVREYGAGTRLRIYPFITPLGDFVIDLGGGYSLFSLKYVGDIKITHAGRVRGGLGWRFKIKRMLFEVMAYDKYYFGSADIPGDYKNYQLPSGEFEIFVLLGVRL